jgi:hypothetical protein
MSPSVPMPLRAAAGLAAVAIDEARRLPDRLVGLPVLAVSTALQVSLKAQQRYVELVARGDQLLDQLRGQQEGTPGWARFDDEEPYQPPATTRPSAFDLADESAPPAGEPARDGRPAPAATSASVHLDDMAADHVPEAAEAGTAEPGAHLPGADEQRAEEEIDAVAADPSPYDGYLSAEPPLANYDQLTLAQLRGKLRGLSENQIADLLAYERASGHRAQFVTMLENRLATLRAR